MSPLGPLFGKYFLIIGLLLSLFSAGCLTSNAISPSLEENTTVGSSEPRTPVNVNTASDNNGSVSMSASPGLNVPTEYFDTLILVDNAKQPSTGNLSFGLMHSFGSGFYLPGKSCAVMITCGGTRYGETGCIEAIDYIRIDDSILVNWGESLTKTNADCEIPYRKGYSTLRRSQFTTKKNLEGGFHFVQCLHYDELSTEYLSVSYHCMNEEDKERNE